MQIILHIGMHKTGTTAIQMAMGNGLPGLATLRMGRNNNHGRAFAKAFPEPKTKTDLKESRKKLAQMAGQLADCTEDRFLISGERISLANSIQLIRFRDFAALFCDQIRVIGYVRPPHEVMQSHFQQRLKGGLAGTYREFDEKNWYPNYRRRLQKFDEVFDRSNVTLKLFHRKHLFGGDIITDFCEEIGISVPSDRLNEANTSLSLEAVSLLYVLRQFGPDINWSSKVESRREQIVAARIAEIGSRRFFLSPSVTRPVIESHRDDVQWIEHRLGTEFTKPLSNGPEAVTSQDDLLRIAMELAPDVSDLLSLDHKGAISTPTELAAALTGLRQHSAEVK